MAFHLQEAHCVRTEPKHPNVQLTEKPTWFAMLWMLSEFKADRKKTFKPVLFLLEKRLLFGFRFFEAFRI